MTCSCEKEAAQVGEKRTLWLVLGINAFMFGVELVSGLAAESSGLLADSLDMLADAAVYGVALWAIGRPDAAKAQAAGLGGVLQCLLAAWVLVEAVRRFLGHSEPLGTVMMIVSVVALLANTACVFLLRRHRDAGVHIQASIIFSQSDVLANLGVLMAGGLVAFSNSRIPDLVVGAIISLLVLTGGIRILKRTAESLRASAALGASEQGRGVGDSL